MTKRHFIALAAALRATSPYAATLHGTTVRTSSGADARRQWLADIAAVADVCAASSARFDRDRFLFACHPSTPSSKG